MLNKSANVVAAAVQAKTLEVIGLTVGIVVVGLALFGYASAHMLRPLKDLMTAAGEVAHGNLDMVIPVPRSLDEVGRLTRTFNTMLEGLRQRDFIRDTFGRYLSKEVVEEVLESPDGLKLGGEMREITILVSDLRGFTSLTADMSPHDVIDMLNRYLGRMVEVLAAYGGTVDEFLGDGILAFFGAPLAADDDHERAVACAIEMQKALVDINVEQRRRGQPELHMGIGISTGAVIVGNIGSEKRTKYGAVGSAINEAYRIESYTIGGQILLSPSVYKRVEGLVQVRSTQEVQFKGLKEPMMLYDVTGLQGRYACTLPEQTPDAFVPIVPPLPLMCFPIEGSTVSERAIPGTITHLATTAVEVVLDGDIALYSDVKLVLDPSAAPGVSEMYAKVIADRAAGRTTGPTHVCLKFTSLPEDGRAFLAEQRALAFQSAS
jgi:class 3 adenylate cyclase